MVRLLAAAARLPDASIPPGCIPHTNGGLGARAGDNRGFEAYAVFDENGDRITTRNWRMLNPQTQEGWQRPD